MIRKILVGLDSTPFTDTAIRYALELAKTFGAELTGVAVIHKNKLESVGPVPVGGYNYAKKLREFRISKTTHHAAEIIDKFAAACKAEGVVSRVKQETGSPLEIMVSHIRCHDLTILGMQHTFDYGVIDEPKNLVCRLVKEGGQPILACPEKFRPIKRALIVYNGATGSAAAMKRFVQFNLWPDIETRIICFSKDDSKSERLWDDAADYCRLYGVNPKLERVEGSAKASLLSQADHWNADIIVMDNSDLSPFAAHFFDDATLHAIKHSDRALFLA